MVEDGFDFRPVERRESKRFEPPPWELDKFDELARQRAEREAEMPPQGKAALEAIVPEVRTGAPEGVQVEPMETGVTAGGEAGKPAGGGVVPDEAQVSAMLAGLAAEEPRAPESYWKANAVVGSVLVVFGLVFLIWGVAAIVATRRAGTAGVMGGIVMLMFGGGFVFGGLYVVVRTLRQRGVL